MNPSLSKIIIIRKNDDSILKVLFVQGIITINVRPLYDI